MAGRGRGGQHPRGWLALEGGEPLAGGLVRGAQPRLGERRERPTQAALQNLEQEKAETEGGTLHRRILLEHRGVRERGDVRLLGQEAARLLVDPSRRIRGGLA